MEFKTLTSLLEKQKAATIDYPFGDDVMVYKVKGKMFALIGIKNNNEKGLNLKCDPNDAIAYRDIYENIIPGYHMNKKHWNTIYYDKDESIPDDIITEMIEDSYNLVVSKLTRKQKDELKGISK